MDEEGISKLPAPILHHILSFLYAKEAVQMCVVSKSWRHVVSTRPKFNLWEGNFKGDKEKFRNVLDKSLQVYYDQKLSIDDFRVCGVSKFNSELVSLLEKWIPVLIHDLGVKKFDLSFGCENPTDLAASKSLPISNLQMNSSVGSKHLKILHLCNVDIEEESFAKIMSSCPLIERLSLRNCEGLRTINVQNHHNLQSFELRNKDYGRSIEIYLPSSIGRINIHGCPNWYHHCDYFPGLTCLDLQQVPLSDEWFNSLSRNYPCLEDLRLKNCNGFDKFQLSSRSIEYLYITMDTQSTIKATFDVPSIKDFQFGSDHSQSISFTTTTSGEWNSQYRLLLNEKVSLCFLELKRVTCLSLTNVPLCDEWFSSFSRNFPCLEHLLLWECNGFDELKLSSPSIKILKIYMDESTTKATIEAPIINEFSYHANISQSISFTPTSSEWNSNIHLSLDQLDASQWFLKLSELVAALSQSQISLVLNHNGRGNNQHIERLSDISVCCSGSYKHVAVKSLCLYLSGRYYDSFFSDITNGLFRIMRPREITFVIFDVESLCSSLQMGRSEDEGTSTFWQQDLEEVSLEVHDSGPEVEKWHPVQGTINLSEYVKNKRHNVLRFRLFWRE